MRCEIKIFQKLHYIIRYPDDYEKGKTYPVLLFLHGAGTRGTDVEVLKKQRFL